MCILSVRGSDGANMARTAAALGPLELEAVGTCAAALGFPVDFGWPEGELLLLYVGGRSEPSLYDGSVVAVLSRLLFVGSDVRRLSLRAVSSLSVLQFSSGPPLSTVGPDRLV